MSLVAITFYAFAGLAYQAVRGCWKGQMQMLVGLRFNCRLERRLRLSKMFRFVFSGAENIALKFWSQAKLQFRPSERNPMNENYTQARQAANCRGRQCLRTCRTLRGPIERRLGSQRSSVIELATSNPVPRWCERRMRSVEEVLELAGYTPRGLRIPLVDGNRDTIKNVVGSVGGVRIDRGRLVGTIEFARDKRSQALAAKYADRHLGQFESEITPLEIREYADRDEVTRFEIVAIRIT